VALPSSIEPKLIKQHTSDKPIKHDYGMKSLNLEPSKESIYAMSNLQEFSIRERQGRKLLVRVALFRRSQMMGNWQKVGRRRRKRRRGTGNEKLWTGDKVWRRRGWTVYWAVCSDEDTGDSCRYGSNVCCLWSPRSAIRLH
jgi:hypothetical protein